MIWDFLSRHIYRCLSAMVIVANLLLSFYCSRLHYPEDHCEAVVEMSEDPSLGVFLSSPLVHYLSRSRLITHYLLPSFRYLLSNYLLIFFCLTFFLLCTTNLTPSSSPKNSSPLSPSLSAKSRSSLLRGVSLLLISYTPFLVAMATTYYHTDPEAKAHNLLSHVYGIVKRRVDFLV